MPIADAALRDSLIEQLTLIREIAQEFALPLYSIKPHGALYHDILKSPTRAQTLIDSIHAVFTPPFPALVILSTATLPISTSPLPLLPLLREAFADRRYQPDGHLTPRTDPDALITDPQAAAAQALAIAQHNPLPYLSSRTPRSPLIIQAQTLCLHSDTPNAPALARAILAAIQPK